MAGLYGDPVDVFSNRDAPSVPQSSSLIKNHKFCSEPLPMVVIRDSSPTNSADFSIFPPSSHENLTPSSSLSGYQLPQHFSSALLIKNTDPEEAPPLLASPISSLLYPPSNSSPSSSEQFDSDPDGSFPQSPLSYCSSEVDLPPSPLPDSAAPRWWGVALQIIRTKFCSCKVVWTIGNVGLTVAAASVMWWWLRERRRRSLQRSNSVGRLLQITREKDEKIVELLNQIAQLNKLLLGRHKS
ncbi:unnamed protein product [Linum trigynum]|uniref:Uncharacterized protein n=1 Tax=Linum trigynum TaxID=586398 RepID=A0AAV2E6Y2_9ROSI